MFSRTNEELKLFIDGIEKASHSDVTNDLDYTSTCNLKIGVTQATSNDYHGFMNDFAIWNYSISVAEAAELFAEGRDFNPYYVPKENFSINVTNVNDVTATVNGTEYTTTDGHIITNLYNITAELINITLDGGSEYYIKTYTDYNVSENITTTLTAKQNFTINVTNVDTFTATVGGVEYNTTTGVITTNIYEDNETLINITLSASGYYGTNYTDYNVSSNIETTLTVIPIGAVEAGILNVRNSAFVAFGFMTLMLFATIAMMFITMFNNGSSTGAVEAMVMIGISMGIVIMMGFTILAVVAGVII